jgi:hypothetical protein
LLRVLFKRYSEGDSPVLPLTVLINLKPDYAGEESGPYSQVLAKIREEFFLAGDAFVWGGTRRR